MTIQMIGYVYFGGNKSRRIEEYYDNMDDAQVNWERFLDKYDNSRVLGGCVTVIKNEGDNVRPGTYYGANIYIPGTIIGSWNK